MGEKRESERGGLDVGYEGKVETRYGGVKKERRGGREGFFLFFLFSFPSLVVGSRVLRQSGRGLPGDFYGMIRFVILFALLIRELSLITFLPPNL